MRLGHGALPVRLPGHSEPPHDLLRGHRPGGGGTDHLGVSDTADSASPGFGPVRGFAVPVAVGRQRVLAGAAPSSENKTPARDSRPNTLPRPVRRSCDRAEPGRHPVAVSGAHPAAPP